MEPVGGRAHWLRRLEAQEGSKVHMAGDTVGHLVAVYVRPASGQERALVFELRERSRLCHAPHSRGCLGGSRLYGVQPRQDAKAHGIELQLIKLGTRPRLLRSVGCGLRP